jgi:putative peptidoglycan lipid II flippase
MNLFQRKSLVGTVFQNTIVGFCSKLLTYVNFSIVAYIFGAQVVTDIYYLGSSFVTACAGIFVILCTSVFSPILIRVKLTNGLDAARRFGGSFLFYFGLILLVVNLVVFFFPVPIFSLVSKFPTVALEENQQMLALFSVIVFLFVLGEFARVYIQSLGFFSVVAYIIFLQSLLFVLLILALVNVFDGLAMAVAWTISLCMQVLLLYFFCRRNKILPLINASRTGLHIELIKTSVPLLIAHVITLGVTYFYDYIASGLSQGILTANTFAARLYILPVVLLFNPMLEVINVRFSEYYQNNVELLAVRYVELQRFFILVLTPVMFVCVFFRLEIVKIVFVRGAFTMDDALITAECFGIYAVSIVSFCLLSVIARVYFVMQKTGLTSLAGIMNQLLALAIVIFAQREIGYLGIPLSKVVAEIFFLLPVSFYLVNNYLPNNGVREILKPFAGLCVLCAVLGFLSYKLFTLATARFDITGSLISQLTSLAAIVLVFFGAYLIILHAIGFKEIRFAVEKAKSFFNGIKR